jgi:hypothetical protein
MDTLVQEHVQLKNDEKGNKFCYIHTTETENNALTFIHPI